LEKEAKEAKKGLWIDPASISNMEVAEKKPVSDAWRQDWASTDTWDVTRMHRLSERV
jgi:hypothetical protein